MNHSKRTRGRNLVKNNRNVVTADIDFPRLWFATVDRDCRHLVDEEELNEVVNIVLEDSRGWQKFGYEFVPIEKHVGLVLRRDASNWPFTFHIRMSSEDTIKNRCGFGGLSCADMAKNVILLNCSRWLFGSEESGLDLGWYRYYMIGHEIGHLLGRGHQQCSADKQDSCPLLYQQTISRGCCKPNPFPLDWE